MRLVEQISLLSFACILLDQVLTILGGHPPYICCPMGHSVQSGSCAAQTLSDFGNV